MAFKTIASYEVLAQPIAPIPNVPYAQQGSFLQISNLDAAAKTIDIEYVGTPVFQAMSGSAPSTVALFVNMIDQTGAITAYNVNEFLIAPVGFKGIPIPGHATFLFGVQYILTGTTPAAPGIEARGFIRLQGPAGAKLLVLATTRQVFKNYASDGPPGTVTDIAESAYPVPLVGGPEVSF